jgi:hypothetical protein
MPQTGKGEETETAADKPVQIAHAVTTTGIPDQMARTVLEYAFLTESRYSSNTFVGVLIDTGAAEVSTAGYAQYLAYRKVAKGVTLDLSTAGQANIRFGAGNPIESISTIDIETPVGNIQFHVVKAMTPFLLSLKDMDQLGVYFNNTKNVLVSPEPHMTAPIVRRFGHPFLI